MAIRYVNIWDLAWRRRGLERYKSLEAKGTQARMNCGGRTRKRRFFLCILHQMSTYTPRDTYSLHGLVKNKQTENGNAKRNEDIVLDSNYMAWIGGQVNDSK
ncbi:hypothetical protein X798_04883 [Onchocerca flexuosa]|uniref:Uncharacterized protein n=1 Tax=Onchocerca flexuosa TaxID=387005 RepID=A0A238BS63_9BILA|nr:hypothetical protein X798_04883 [Onchocerca flexuosa]